MKRSVIILAAAALLLFLPLCGCTGLVKGSGELKTEEFPLNDFSRIEVDGPFVVTITGADSFRVSITADDNLFENLEVTEEEDTLFIRLKSAQYVDITARVSIRVPHLRGLGLDGAAEGSFSRFDSRAGLDFTLSGASVLDIRDVSVGDAGFDVSGASTSRNRAGSWTSTATAF